MENGRDRLNNLIKQAASVHILNVVYFLAMIVLTGFAFSLSPQNNFDTLSPLLNISFILFLVFFFKCAMHYYSTLQQKIPIEQFELLVTVCNVCVTLMLLSTLNDGRASSSIVTLLNSFMPALLIVLITPLTWRKPSDIKYYGFFGFLEWAILLVVLAWSSNVIFNLLLERSYFSVATNIVVLLGPIFLGWMRGQYMNRVLNKMHEEIYVDTLTKIPNRKAYYDFYDAWRAKVSKKQVNKDGFAVLLADVDHFKAFNDHYGHDVGDSCLREVARNLSEIAKTLPGAEVYRYGGEEFVMLFPANKDELETLLEETLLSDWLKGTLRLPMDHVKSPYGKVTLSGCLTHVSNNFIYTNNALGVVGLVDHKLYKAKERRAILVFE